MLQVARLAPLELGEATATVVEYLRDQFNADGGGRDRAGASDLYYTVFALEGLAALRAEAEAPRERLGAYLASFGGGEELDLVHLAALARSWASLGAGALGDCERRRILDRIESFRAADGGYAGRPGAARGSAYHAFLAYGAYQDLGAEAPRPADLRASLAGLVGRDGGCSNEAGLAAGTTPATAAVITLLRQLEAAPPSGAGSWLLERACPGGGFRAVPGAPIPDLLSTATALHALAGSAVSFAAIKEPCLDFVDSLWTGRAFCGSWSDECPDPEYTFYALLALGHLSL
ncbi:MAG TPA: prenyltransferase/squalene oxidase repeat-containing protein [Thermoanaerobaculia bacterium]|nr:prenyltransferase/squalene oxidase repeat-containing protein [Thermoanaerobaculia bacterium]